MTIGGRAVGFPAGGRHRDPDRGLLWRLPSIGGSGAPRSGSRHDGWAHPDQGGIAGPGLETNDGVELATRIWPATDRARAVVVAHGLTANKDEHRVVSLSAALQREGFEVIAYDSRGHGQSGGQCTVGDLERHDVASAVAWGRTRNSGVVLVGARWGRWPSCRMRPRTTT
jgi:hypothetical protein